MSEVTNPGIPQNTTQGAPENSVVPAPTAGAPAATPPASPAAGGSLVDPGPGSSANPSATPGATTVQPSAPATGTTTPEVPPTQTTAPTAPVQKVVPEKYDLKAPEKSLLTPEAIKRVEDYAKANQLSQDEAQRELVRESDSVSRLQNSVNQAMKQQVDTWINEVKSDPIMGGANFDKTVRLAQIGVRKMDDPELIKELNQTGLGNNPRFIRAFAKIGAMFEDDKTVHGGNPVGAAQVDPLKVLYDKQTK